jgi:glycosyltransferase involved in cell wall biosynthesis
MIIKSQQLIANPDISVFIITYNQEQTIAQTIESILMQEGDFTLELVIGEDCGTDGTREICKSYQQKYPERITLLLQDTNQGITKNYIDTLRLCRGKYLNVCAGDDYWCDKQKVAKQLTFFAENPDYGAVTTGGYRLLVEKNEFIEGIAPLHPVADGNVFDKTWRGGVYAMPLSLLFKAELLKYFDFDEFIRRKFSVEDVPMQAIMAKHTKFGHIPDLCVVYRVYNSSQTFINFNHPRYLFYHQGLVEIRRYLNELFPGEVEFSEEWAHDYMVYRRFLVAVYKFDYHTARKELLCLHKCNSKEQKALRRTKTRIGFYIFALVKRWKLKQSEMI